jgi:hypothetical protein
MGVLEAGARVKLYELDEWMFSAQGTLREATNTRSRVFVDMGHGLQADVRLLIGRTFTLLGFPAFSSLEIGYRSPGGFGHEIRADATVGVRPFDKLLVLLQTFNISAVHTTPLYPTRSNKITLSAVYDVTPSIAVQIGGIVGLPGVNTTTERGIISALWSGSDPPFREWTGPGEPVTSALAALRPRKRAGSSAARAGATGRLACTLARRARSRTPRSTRFRSGCGTMRMRAARGRRSG